MKEIIHYGSKFFMVWAGIILDPFQRAPLHVCGRGSVSGVKYKEETLEPYVRLFRNVVGPDFILMDDNERSHLELIWSTNFSKVIIFTRLTGQANLHI